MRIPIGTAVVEETIFRGRGFGGVRTVGCCSRFGGTRHDHRGAHERGGREQQEARVGCGRSGGRDDGGGGQQTPNLGYDAATQARLESMPDQDGLDPMQRFHARQPQPAPYLDASIGKPQLFRAIRDRAGSPLKVRIPYALSMLLIFIGALSDAADRFMYIVAGSALITIVASWIYSAMARASMWTIRSWLFMPNRDDAEATRFEWILFFATAACVLGTVITIALRQN